MAKHLICPVWKNCSKGWTKNLIFKPSNICTVLNLRRTVYFMTLFLISYILDLAAPETEKLDIFRRAGFKLVPNFQTRNKRVFFCFLLSKKCVNWVCNKFDCLFKVTTKYALNTTYTLFWCPSKYLYSHASFWKIWRSPYKSHVWETPNLSTDADSNIGKIYILIPTNPLGSWSLY